MIYLVRYQRLCLQTPSLCLCISSLFLSHPMSLSHTQTPWYVFTHSLSLSHSLPSLSLQDCLAEGRSVSLPASAVGASKLAVTAVGAYARIRKQFRVPIAEMGGVQVTHDYQSILFLHFWFNYFESCLYEYEHSMLVLIKIGLLTQSYSSYSNNPPSYILNPSSLIPYPSFFILCHPFLIFHSYVCVYVFLGGYSPHSCRDIYHHIRSDDGQLYAR